jgi:hypothetical protein
MGSIFINPMGPINNSLVKGLGIIQETFITPRTRGYRRIGG